MIKRAIIIVLDSLGVGEMPDAAKYGDQGADTLGHILDRRPQLKIPNLQKLGMGNIQDAAGGRLKIDHPEGVYGRSGTFQRQGHDNRSLGDRRTVHSKAV